MKPIPNQTFGELLCDSVKAFKQNTLLFDTSEGRSINYTDCLTLSEMVSAKLVNSGLQKGDIVLNYSPLSVESVILCWACLKSGLIFLPVDHNWPENLLKQVIEESSPSLILTDKKRLLIVESNYFSDRIITNDSDHNLTNSFYNWLEKEDPEINKSIEKVKSGDPAIILYTSGSTGVPKGVVLSQHALCNSGKLVSKHFDWQPLNSFMNLGDLHSMSGLRNTCIAPFHNGSTSIIAQSEERNNILYIFDLIEKLHINYIGVAPTVIRQMNVLFSHKRKNQLSTLKAIICTGGLLAKNQLELFYNNYNKPVYNYYGLTETAGLCSGHNAETFSPDDNSIGVPVGAEFMIIPEPSYKNPNIGELLVKSNNLMLGYYKRDKETSEVLKNGFFYTGDIVKKRNDGCYELLGRKRNTIKNIYSELIHLEEIDQALEKHHLIKEACTCGCNHLEEDEKIVAFIVPTNYPSNTESQFINIIKKHMNEIVGVNRTPWCYYIEKELPRNTMGKVKRQSLTEKLNVYIKSERTRYF